MTTADEYKLQGNAELKAKHYEQAIQLYTKAIEIQPTAVYYSNRAQAYILTMEQFGLALNDANSAIQLDRNYLKGYYRRAVAHAGMMQYKEALKDVNTVIAHAPNDKNSQKLKKTLTQKINQIRFEKAIQLDEEGTIFDSIDFDNMLDDDTIEGLDLPIHTEKRKRPNSKKDEQIVTVEMTQAYLQRMLQLFKDGKQLPRKHAYAIVAATYNVFKEHDQSLTEIGIPRAKTASKEFQYPTEKITVCGDTHGQFYDVLHLFEEFGWPEQDKHTYLFNGDFVDRGSWSCEVAFTYYCLKLLYPNNFFINRGNHEANDMNQVYGFRDEAMAKYTERMFRCFSESFGALPYSTLIGQEYLVMHGGLFSDDSTNLDDIRAIDRFKYRQPPKEGVEMELLWTDPQEENGRGVSKRGIGVQFGPDVTERFCEANNLRMVFRSHETRQGGYQIEQNGRLITVFSAPNYVDTSGNLGAVIDMTLDDSQEYKYNCRTFSAVPHPDIPPMAYVKNNMF